MKRRTRHDPVAALVVTGLFAGTVGAQSTCLDFDELDDGDPIGRVDLVTHPDGGWIACWLERGDAGGEVRVRRIPSEGDPDPSLLVARTSAERAAGFPRIERRGERVILAWTETALDDDARETLRINHVATSNTSNGVLAFENA